MVIWLIGLSGAGKSTIGRLLADQLRQQHKNLVYLDGDDLRDVWGDLPGHTIDGRAINAQRISHLCRMLDSQGIHVITAILSIFPEWQAWNRDAFSRYHEVFLDVPLEVVQERDAKGLYAAAQTGRMENVVGVDIPFPRPPNPDFVLQPPEVLEAPEAVAQRVFQSLPPFEASD